MQKDFVKLYCEPGTHCHICRNGPSFWNTKEKQGYVMPGPDAMKDCPKKLPLLTPQPMPNMGLIGRIASWPIALKFLELYIQPTDRGIGDTLHRLMQKMGAEWGASIFRKYLKWKCNCEFDVSQLNAKYPIRRH